MLTEFFDVTALPELIFLGAADVTAGSVSEGAEVFFSVMGVVAINFSTKMNLQQGNLSINQLTA
jgi:hypothetical protein